MKTSRILIPLLACANSAQADPILSSRYTQNSSTLARVIQTTNTIPATGTRNTTPVTTWPTTGITNGNTGGLAQTTTVYADVQRIRSTATDVYINSSGTSLAETWSGSPGINTGTGDVTLTWSSVEGGTYTVQASNDLSTWTALSASVSAPANTVLPAPAKVITTTTVTESAAALPANNPRRFYRVTRNP